MKVGHKNRKRYLEFSFFLIILNKPVRSADPPTISGNTSHKEERDARLLKYFEMNLVMNKMEHDQSTYHPTNINQPTSIIIN